MSSTHLAIPARSSGIELLEDEFDLLSPNTSNHLANGKENSQENGGVDLKAGKTPSSFKTDMSNDEVTKHLRLISSTDTKRDHRNTAQFEELRTTPLFSSKVKQHSTSNVAQGQQIFFPQYALLGLRTGIFSDSTQEQTNLPPHENLVYANMNAPWSAFICGSQGAGKSHTLSCLLENALLKDTHLGTLPHPLAGIVFHYDKHTAHNASQICEAAYLCSRGIPVRVFVSPTNFWSMQKLYTNLPGLPKGSPRPVVLPLRLHEDQLTVTNIKTLMAVDNDSSHPPLYVSVLNKILKQMAVDNQGKKGINYKLFKKRLDDQTFTKDQRGPLELRLDLLESFMQVKGAANSKKIKSSLTFERGALTIVDMSCPFVDEKDACALFSICLSLFLEHRSEAGVVIALDEAHKFLTESGEAARFTDDLIGIICQQRHLASRVFIATQEPTLSTRLLDLCNVTLVHRFLSPAWYAILKHHLAGLVGRKVGGEGSATNDVEDVFKTIVRLRTGEALLFSPTSCFDVDVDERTGESQVRSLQEGYVKIRIRDRVTADGGRSILATK